MEIYLIKHMFIKILSDLYLINISKLKSYLKKNVKFTLKMKLILTISFILFNLNIVNLNLFKNSAMRSKLQILLCNIYLNSNEIKELDDNIVELSKDNLMHNNLYITPEKYQKLLDEIKPKKDLVIDFLLVKMTKGDIMAGKIFEDLRNEGNIKMKEINEKEVLERVRNIVQLTDGIGSSNHAKYLAFEYMKNYDKQKYMKCGIIIDTRTSFLERTSKTRTKTKTWQSIKYYKEPQHGMIRNLKYWMKEKEHFPKVMLYGQQYPNDCNFENSATMTLVNDIDDVELKPNCYLQIIARKSDNTKETHEISIMINEKKHNVKFFVSHDKLDYNCIGWAVGLQDFMELYLYTEPRSSVYDLRAFKLYMLQYREALKSIQDKLSNSENSNSELMARIINKRKPAPSLIMSLLNDETLLDSQLVGLEDEISSSILFDICDSRLDQAVIFYGQNNKFSHAARYVSKLNTWTSKLGSSYLVTHDLNFLSDSKAQKSLYGKPKFIFCPKAVNRGAIGIKHDRIDFS